MYVYSWAEKSSHMFKITPGQATAGRGDDSGQDETAK